VSAEVLAFAAEQGVTAELAAVWEMTRRIFPNAPLTVLVEEDPEIANDCHIVFEVDAAGMQVPELVAAQQRWSAELFQHCPATHAPVFRLGMV
jgi:hypothetical protein